MRQLCKTANENEKIRSKYFRADDFQFNKVLNLCEARYEIFFVTCFANKLELIDFY